MKRSRNPGGFTLMEMLVALAVFSVVGLICGQLVSRTLDNYEIVGQRGARLAEAQRAMQILKRDLTQLANRPVRDLLGDPQGPLTIGGGGLIEFSRMGWRNPLGQMRSDVQRVAYVMEDGDLHRVWWKVLDRAQDSEPSRQRLLADVEQAEFLALDAAGNEHSFWPPSGYDEPPEEQAEEEEETEEEIKERLERRLAAIVLRLQFPPFGYVERIWPVSSV